MLTNVVVVAPSGVTFSDFSIPVLNPGVSGLFISKVDGLTPVASNVVTKDYGIGDGEYFVGSHRGKRNIVLTIGMESRGASVESARQSLYNYFYRNQGDFLKLRFEFDNRDPVEIIGYLETNEGDRFSQDPETQISIVCPKPNFSDPTQQTLTGTISSSPAYVSVLNLGNQSMGFLIRIIPTPGDGFDDLGPLTYEVAVPGSAPGTYSTYRFMQIFGTGEAFPIEDDEEFWLDSRQGRKSVYILNTTTGQRRNALHGMQDESRWPILHPGNNVFRLTGYIPYRWDIYYNYEFGGV